MLKSKLKELEKKIKSYFSDKVFVRESNIEVSELKNGSLDICIIIWFTLFHVPEMKPVGFAYRFNIPAMQVSFSQMPLDKLIGETISNEFDNVLKGLENG